MNSDFLCGTPLFGGIRKEEINGLLKCLNAFTKKYEKGEYIYCCGDTAENIGLVLSGAVIIKNDDFWGNQSVLAHIAAGQVFAESYALIKNQPLLVDAVAAVKAEVLFINGGKINSPCGNLCPCHKKLTDNLLRISALKNVRLSRRILYTSSKTIRGRLMSFLSDEAREQGSRKITIPFDRQQLADYLNVERSALCAQLSKMQKDGILEYHKNSFVLKTQ